MPPVVFNIRYGTLTFLFLRALNSVVAVGCYAGIEGETRRLCSIAASVLGNGQKPGCGGEKGGSEISARRETARAAANAKAAGR
jgi:hypothetical protein